MELPMDRIDFEILDLLQKNARLSNKELAAAVGLAPSTCLVRVQRLREAKVLGAARMEVSPDALGIGLQAMVAVRLKQHSRAQVRAFWKHLLSLKEVRSVFHVTGEHDFLVHVLVRDAHHLKDLAMDAFTSRPEVGHLQTSLLFDVAHNPVLPNYRQAAGSK